MHSKRTHACHNADPKISRRLSRIVHSIAIHEFAGGFVRTTEHRAEGGERRKVSVALSEISRVGRETRDGDGWSRLVDGICRKGRKETGK